MAERPRRGLAVLLVLALATAGCGDGTADDAERRTVGDATATSRSQPSEVSTAAGPGEEAADAYAAWLDALARQDAVAACALQAPELTIELRLEAVLVDRAELGDPCTEFEALLWEDPEFDSEIVDVAVTQETEEDALLAVRLASTDLTVRMVDHRARWRVFSTEDRSDPGSDGSGGAESGPARWVAAWCSLSSDLTRDEIVALMGEPSGEYTVADGGEPQLWWARDQYDFRVYLDPADPDDPVLELVADYDALGADDRALLRCPELRR